MINEVWVQWNGVGSRRGGLDWAMRPTEKELGFDVQAFTEWYEAEDLWSATFTC